MNIKKIKKGRDLNRQEMLYYQVVICEKNAVGSERQVSWHRTALGAIRGLRAAERIQKTLLTNFLFPCNLSIMSPVNQNSPKLNLPKSRLLVHRIRLEPNNKQTTYFKRAAGIKRYAYNWAKAESTRAYREEKVTLTGFDLVKRFNSLKDAQFPFVRQVTKWAPQKAIYDYWNALNRFWEGLRGTGPKCGFPRYKKKNRARDSFYIGSVKVDGHYLSVPRLGPVRMSQRLRFSGKIRSVTISRDASYWFASILVEVDKTWGYSHTCETQAVVGVDLGLRSLAVLSDGTCVTNPKWFEEYRRKLRRFSRRLARRKLGSNRWCKQKERVGRLHYRIVCLRKEYLHKLTAGIVCKYRYIGAEDLNCSGMLRNTRLAKSLADASFGEIRRQLAYKSKLAGSHLVLADQWFASTQICSCCDKKRTSPLRLSDRSWTCPNCGTRHDRDSNAAENLRKVAARYAETINTRGAEGSGVGHKPYVKPTGSTTSTTCALLSLLSTVATGCCRRR